MWYGAVGCLVTLILSLLAAPLTAEAQQPGQMLRIGFVEPGAAAVNGHFLAAFRQGLRAFGWVEGQNLVIEDRWAEGQLSRMPANALSSIWRAAERRDPQIPSSARPGGTGAVAWSPVTR